MFEFCKSERVEGGSREGEGTGARGDEVIERERQSN